jgi:hypothetical protein
MAVEARNTVARQKKAGNGWDQMVKAFGGQGGGWQKERDGKGNPITGIPITGASNAYFTFFSFCICDKIPCT